MPPHLVKLIVKEFPARLIYYLRHKASASSAPVVLMYHSVNNHTRHRLVVQPSIFRAQIQYLLSNHWQVVPLSETIAEINAPTPKIKKVALTFDDGYEDNYSVVADILREYAIPATIFLISDYVGTKKIFPWFETTEKWAVSMNWNQIGSLQQSGMVEFGAHTKTHPLLSTVTSEKSLEREIITSKRSLEAKLGRVNYFCYPAGDYTSKATSMVQKAGYLGAVSVEPGFVKASTDPFLVPRIEISGLDESIHAFARKITGCYIPFHKALQHWQKLIRHSTR